MKFEKFSGTSDLGKRADFADEIKHVSASDSSKRDAAGIANNHSVETAIDEIDSELIAISARKAQLDARFGQIKYLRSVKLSKDEYRRLSDESRDLRREYSDAQSKAADLKARKASLTRDAKKAAGFAGRKDQIMETNRLLSLILKELKKISSSVTQKGNQ